jgi:hypothetical protein
MNVIWWVVIALIAVGVPLVRHDRASQDPRPGSARGHRRSAAAGSRPHSERSHHREAIHGARAQVACEITELRTKAHQRASKRDFAKVAEKFKTDARLGQHMGSLLILAENYLELRLDGPMIEAHVRTHDFRPIEIVEARLKVGRDAS